MVDQALIGLLLSDGNLEKPTKNGGVRFTINLSSNSTSFLLHIYNLYEPYINSEWNISKIIKENKEYNSIRLKTVPNLERNKYFYQSIYWILNYVILPKLSSIDNILGEGIPLRGR